jgi:hypothetical protein
MLASLVAAGIAISIATGYGLDGRGSIPDRGKRFFPIPQRPDRLWGPPNLLNSGYWGVTFPGGKAARGRR